MIEIESEEMTNIKNSLGVYIHAISLEEFMKQDPPCKECLIRSICIKETNHKYPSLIITVCEEFNKHLMKMSEEYVEKKIKT